MDEDMQYLRTRVDGIAETLAKNTTVLEQNTESLKEHMRRTEILEERVGVLYRYKYVAAGAVAALATIGSLFLEHFKKGWPW